MTIKNIIFHEVRKNEAQQKALIIERNSENEIDDHAEELGLQLSGLFRKTGLYIGQFSKGESETDPKPHFLSLLEQFYNPEKKEFSEFVKFTVAATKYFKLNLDDSHSGKGGYLLFNHYTFNDTNYLSVVLLRKISGLAISEKLTLAEIERLDLDKLHMAARIDITAWLKGETDKYISFRIGRSAKELTDYFSKFIGCEEATAARIDTQNLVQVTKRYCIENKFDDLKSQEVKDFVYERCTYWLDNDKPILIDTLSELLDGAFEPGKEGKFIEIAQNEPFYLNNNLPIERAALRGLTRYSAKTKKLSISFDSDLVGKSIFFEKETGHLKLTEIPEVLKQQLLNDPKL